MLLPDYDEEVFAPWASVGLDATTLHRLRLPVSEFSASLDDGETGFHWTGEQCTDLAPYFSRREASMLENLLVFPFVADGSIRALLLITETPYFGEHLDYLRLILAAIGEPAAREIHERRLVHAYALHQAIVFKRAEIPVVADRVASRAPQGTRLVIVQLADIVSQVATTVRYIDPYRVWQDVLRASATLFATTASVCDADDRRALFLVHGAIDEDTQLIVQHLAATLAYLFPELSAVPVLRFESALYPDDGKEIVALANALL